MDTIFSNAGGSCVSTGEKKAGRSKFAKTNSAGRVRARNVPLFFSCFSVCSLQSYSTYCKFMFGTLSTLIDND